jgi:hypothetical protein
MITFRVRKLSKSWFDKFRYKQITEQKLTNAKTRTKEEKAIFCLQGDFCDCPFNRGELCPGLRAHPTVHQTGHLAQDDKGRDKSRID